MSARSMLSQNALKRRCRHPASDARARSANKTQTCKSSRVRATRGRLINASRQFCNMRAANFHAWSSICQFGCGHGQLFRQHDSEVGEPFPKLAPMQTTEQWYACLLIGIKAAAKCSVRAFTPVTQQLYRPPGALPMTPNWDDFTPAPADRNPSAASPRLSSSRTADARLGIRRLARKQ
jgi:hypothetical protein